MQDKRKYPRFDVAAKISFEKVRTIGDDTGTKEAFVKNISAEGFCFSSKEELKSGDILEVQIAEKDIEGSPICIKGQVVWSDKDSEAKDCQPFLTGVKVLGVRKTDEARFIMLYCERMLIELKSFLRM